LAHFLKRNLERNQCHVDCNAIQHKTTGTIITYLLSFIKVGFNSMILLTLRYHFKNHFAPSFHLTQAKNALACFVKVPK